MTRGHDVPVGMMRNWCDRVQVWCDRIQVRMFSGGEQMHSRPNPWCPVIRKGGMVAAMVAAWVGVVLSVALLHPPRAKGQTKSDPLELLRKAGAEVLFSDVDEAAVEHFCNEVGLQCFLPDEVYEIPCDIFAPCAVGGVLNEKTIPRLRCRAVVGAANNQLATPEDALRLRERGILYATDFIANSGGAIAIIGMETRGWSRKKAEQKVTETIKDNLSQVLELAETESLDTDEAARRLAEQRLAKQPKHSL